MPVQQLHEAKSARQAYGNTNVCLSCARYKVVNVLKPCLCTLTALYFHLLSDMKAQGLQQHS